MSHIGDLFRAISDKTRREILLHLEEKECCAGELVSKFALSQPTVSKHLNILRQAGLVASRREGQQVIYSLDDGGLQRCCSEYFTRFRCCCDAFSDSEDVRDDSARG